MKITLSKRPAAGSLAVLSLLEHLSLAAVCGLLFFVISRPANAAEGVQTGPAVRVTHGAGTPAEAAYVMQLHEQLDRAKRYPTGREASLTHPSGTTAVWVDVSREGRVIGRGVAKSSGSGLLDQMASMLVGRARYVALPTGDWTATAVHRFLVSYRFHAEDDTAGTGPLVALDVR